MTANMRFLPIIIQTHAIPAANSLPKLSLLDLTRRWLGENVIRLALTQRTMMIDRALAEDLAAIFDVDINEIPSGVKEIDGFIRSYMAKHTEHESVPELLYRLGTISQKLQNMLVDLNENLGQ